MMGNPLEIPSTSMIEEQYLEKIKLNSHVSIQWRSGTEIQLEHVMGFEEIRIKIRSSSFERFIVNRAEK